MCLCPNHGPCTDPAVEVGRPCLWSRPQHTLLSSLLGLALNHAGSCLCLGHQVTLLRPHLHHCHEPVWVLHVFKVLTNIPEPVWIVPPLFINLGNTNDPTSHIPLTALKKAGSDFCKRSQQTLLSPRRLGPCSELG